MAHQSYRAESTKDWGTSDEGQLNIHQVNTGCLLRIADATEKMATNFIQLQNDRDLYKRWYEERRVSNTKLHRRIQALRGVITRLKNKKK